MKICWSVEFSGCAEDGRDQELDVAVVEACDGVPEVDGDAVGQACGDLQHPLLASGAGKAGVRGGDDGGPVDDGYRLAAAGAAVDGDELAGEVGPLQPGLGDEELSGGCQAAAALGVVAQRGSDAV